MSPLLVCALLAGCNQAPAGSGKQSNNPLAQLFGSSGGKVVPAALGDLCYTPTLHYQETLPNGQPDNTRYTCEPGDSIEEAIERYRDNPNVVRFSVEQAGKGVIIHSAVRNPVSQETVTVDFDMDPHGLRWSDGSPQVVRGPVYVDGVVSPADGRSIDDMLMRPDYKGGDVKDPIGSPRTMPPRPR